MFSRLQDVPDYRSVETFSNLEQSRTAQNNIDKFWLKFHKGRFDYTCIS